MAEVGGALDVINSDIRRRHPRQPVVVSVSGEREQMRESFRSLQFALFLAVLLVYMIMASEFESFWQPFIIMFTVPLGVIGVAWTLWLTGTSLNVVVMLGMIMLAGTVVSNGIILVDSINAERAGSKAALPEAVVAASRTRLRPILMTSLTTVLGALPIALSKTMMASLALAVMGGMTFSMVLTLGVVPLLYLLVAQRLAPIRLMVPQAAVGLEPALAVPGLGGSMAVSEATAPIVTVVEPVPTTTPSPAVATQPPSRVSPAAPVHEPVAPPVTPPDDQAVVAEEEAVAEGEMPLNRRQERLLEHLRQVKRITRKEYADVFGISVPTAARDLKELLDRRLIRARGPLGPGRWYEMMP